MPRRPSTASGWPRARRRQRWRSPRPPPRAGRTSTPLRPLWTDRDPVHAGRRRQMTLGTRSDPLQYRGQITGLRGPDITARVVRPGYAALTVLARLEAETGTAPVNRTVTARAQEG